MTKFEVRIQQTHFDFYHIEADNVESARQQVFTGVCSGILGNAELNDTIKHSPIINYAIPFPSND